MRTEADSGRQEVVLYAAGGGSGGTPTPSPIGGSSILTAQGTITVGGVLVADAEPTRIAITVEQMGTVDVYIGGPTVTSATGMLLVGVRGASLTLATTAELWGITASGSAAVCTMEIRQ